jgi:hypothetical protein
MDNLRRTESQDGIIVVNTSGVVNTGNCARNQHLAVAVECAQLGWLARHVASRSQTMCVRLDCKELYAVSNLGIWSSVLAGRRTKGTSRTSRTRELGERKENRVCRPLSSAVVNSEWIVPSGPIGPAGAGECWVWRSSCLENDQWPDGNMGTGIMERETECHLEFWGLESCPSPRGNKRMFIGRVFLGFNPVNPRKGTACELLSRARALH